MTIAIVIGVGFLSLLVGHAVGSTNTTNPLALPCLACRHDCGHSHLISENFALRKHTEYLDAALRREREMRTQMNYRPIYARTPNEQKVVDLVINASKPLDELKAELGIK